MAHTILQSFELPGALTIRCLEGDKPAMKVLSAMKSFTQFLFNSEVVPDTAVTGNTVSVYSGSENPFSDSVHEFRVYQDSQPDREALRILRRVCIPSAHTTVKDRPRSGRITQGLYGEPY